MRPSCALRGLRELPETWRRRALGLDQGRQSIRVPSARGTNVADSVGAGDAFNAGYLAGCIEDSTLHAAMSLGAWVASTVVSQTADYEGFPSADEISDWRAGERAAER